MLRPRWCHCHLIILLNPRRHHLVTYRTPLSHSGLLRLEFRRPGCGLLCGLRVYLRSAFDQRLVEFRFDRDGYGWVVAKVYQYPTWGLYSRCGESFGVYMKASVLIRLS